MQLFFSYCGTLNKIFRERGLLPLKTIPRFLNAFSAHRRRRRHKNTVTMFAVSSATNTQFAATKAQFKHKVYFIIWRSHRFCSFSSSSFYRFQRGTKLFGSKTIRFFDAVLVGKHFGSSWRRRNRRRSRRRQKGEPQHHRHSERTTKEKKTRQKFQPMMMMIAARVVVSESERPIP